MSGSLSVTRRFRPISNPPAPRAPPPIAGLGAALDQPNPQDLWFERDCVWYIGASGQSVPIAFMTLPAVYLEYFALFSTAHQRKVDYGSGPFGPTDIVCAGDNPHPELGSKGSRFYIAATLTAAPFVKRFCQSRFKPISNPGPLYPIAQMRQMIVSSPSGSITVWPKYLTIANTLFTSMAPANFMNNLSFRQA